MFTLTDGSIHDEMNIVSDVPTIHDIDAYNAYCSEFTQTPRSESQDFNEFNGTNHEPHLDSLPQHSANPNGKIKVFLNFVTKLRIFFFY